MRLGPLLVALLLTSTVAGCTFGREKESVDVDKGGYRGGEGVAFAMVNEADGAFNVTLRVLAVGNVEIARFDERLEPGDSIERWVSTDGSGMFSARMSYVWSARGGSTAYGEDDETFRTADCPKVTRLAWTMLERDDTVGSRFEGATCVDEEGEEWKADDAASNATENR